MKKHPFVFLIPILFLATACQNKQQSAENQDDNPTTIPVEPATITDGTYCYELREGQDVTSIRLTLNGEEVTGEMKWMPLERDGGYGTLAGKRSGDEIMAIWSYTIEGSAQTEEVIFKIEGDQLLRKVGELEDPNFDGNLKFKDPAAAKFSETFEQVPCE